MKTSWQFGKLLRCLELALFTTLSISCTRVCGNESGLGRGRRHGWGVNSGLLGEGNWTPGFAASWQTHHWEADAEKYDWLVGFSAIGSAPFPLPWPAFHQLCDLQLESFLKLLSPSTFLPFAHCLSSCFFFFFLVGKEISWGVGRCPVWPDGHLWHTTWWETSETVLRGREIT